MYWFFWDAMIFCNNFMAPKRRFLKVEQTVRNVVSKHFSIEWVLDLGYDTLKTASKRRSERFVRPSKSSFGEHKLCEMITKDGSNMWCRARNPRFSMPLFGQKTGFRARMNEIKSGIPCSDVMCWVFWDATIFCNNFARWLQKIVSTCDVFSRVPLLPHFDKPAFSRIPENCEPQIVVEMFEEFVKRRVCQMGEEWHTAGCVGFSGMLWSFVTTLQDDYKR